MQKNTFNLMLQSLAEIAVNIELLKALTYHVTSPILLE